MSQVQKVKEEKKNTDAWKSKQEMKKKKQVNQPVQTTQDEDNKKVDKKADKKVKTKQSKKQQSKQQQQKQKLITKTQPLQTTEQPKQTHRELSKIYNKLTQEQINENIQYQERLVINYMDKQISTNDVVLYIGESVWNPECPQVYIKNFNRCEDAELVCLYPDISYFIQGSVTKIFVEAEFIFANGSLLAKKGALNIILLAKYFNIPVVACGGSWNYNGWAPLTEQALTERYSEQILQKYDWIQTKYLKSSILQVGIINPKQFPIYPPIIYKSLDLSSIEW